MNDIKKEIQVIGDRIALDVTPPNRSRGGLLIPSFALHETEHGVILCCGPEVHSSALAPGVHVVFGRFAGSPFEVDGRNIKVVREEDIMLIIPEDEEESSAKLHTA